jgi:hypothetical protein
MDDLVHLDTSCLKNQKKILDKICLKIHFVFLFKYAEAVLLHVEPMPPIYRTSTSACRTNGSAGRTTASAGRTNGSACRGNE